MINSLGKEAVASAKTLATLEYDKIVRLLTDKASSPMTREVLEALAPVTDPLLIRERLQETAEAEAILQRKGAPPLGRFTPVASLAHLAAKEGRLTPGQLLEVAYNLACARRTAAFLKEETQEVRIRALVSALSILQETEEEIGRCILSEEEIADGASPELRRIRRAILRQGEAIRTRIQRMVASTENRAFLQDALVTMRQGRYVLPVKLEHKNRLPGIIHDQSASGATLFVEPEAIVLMNNELRQLELDEKKEVDRILTQLSGLVGASQLQIKGNQEILLKLDVFFAKGALALEMEGSKPETESGAALRILRGRHPLIPQDQVVAIDLLVEEGDHTLVITGPNTGGKTVTLKTVGLFCLMAQSGLFVPADPGTRLPLFTGIFADIGDEQSIEQSLSTFSSHMRNIVSIVGLAGKGSLVLLDELGAGTDPTEGAALAMAILDHLGRRGATTLATTHYTELKKYALATPGVTNASMEFDVETLSPTFRLLIGIPGKSNAFEISRKLGLRSDIIAQAAGLLERGDIRFEEVLSSIEEEKKRTEKAMDEALALKLSLLKQQEQLDRAEEGGAKKREELLSQAKAEARQLLKEARQSVDEAAKELDSIRSGRALDGEEQSRLQEQKRLLAEQEKGLRQAVPAPVNLQPPALEDLRPGLRVQVLTLGEKGTILSEPDDKGSFQVQVGPLKVQVRSKDVTLVQENVRRRQKEKARHALIYRQKAQSVSPSLNVVGYHLDQAELEVDKYLDDAFLAGLKQVSIIHGRGEGILREGLASALKRHRHVQAFRSGTYQEGGEGVTIVSLKER